jgi:hypothetical protein
MTDTQTPTDDVAFLRRQLVAQRLAGPAATTAPAQPDRPRRVTAPLTSAQRRLWILDRLSPHSVEYLVPLVLRLRGDLDTGLLRRSLTDLVARHEILRTRYPERDGEPVQVIDPPAPVALPPSWRPRHGWESASPPGRCCGPAWSASPPASTCWFCTCITSRATAGRPA